MKQYFVLLCLSWCVASQLTAQTAKIQLDTNALKIGEQTTAIIAFEYRIDSGEGSDVIWPQLADTLAKSVEIVSVGKIDTAVANNDDPYLFTQSLRLTLTSFDTGYHVIRPLQFSFNGELVESNPALLHIQGMVVDQTKELRDIKDIRAVNYTWFDRLLPYWWVLVIAIGLVVLFFVLKRMSKKEKQKEMVVPVKPREPAHISAIERLRKLKEKGLWQKGLTKAYHTELTDILREYIEERFNVPAMEETSSQLLQELTNYGISKTDLQLLPQLLKTADYVKFAKYKPLPEENEMAMKNALTFIEQTAEVTQAK